MEAENKNTLLVGVYKRSTNREICKNHLLELERLADTYGIDTKDKTNQICHY